MYECSWPQPPDEKEHWVKATVFGLCRACMRKDAGVEEGE